MNSKTLRRNQLDLRLKPVLKAIPPVPRSGWISEIRKALAMTTRQLGRRMGTDQSNVSKLEASEVKRTITLGSLERAADALGCDVRYVLVPREKLGETIWKQAERKYVKEQKRLQRTMSLEDQRARRTGVRRDVEIANLIVESGSKIWDD